MLSPCFLISSDKHVIGSINKQHLIAIIHIIKVFQNIGKLVEHLLTDTDIRNRGNFLTVIRLVDELSDSRNNCRRKIIGAEITEILKCVNDGRFSCSGHSGNNQQIHSNFPSFILQLALPQARALRPFR